MLLPGKHTRWKTVRAKKPKKVAEDVASNELSAMGSASTGGRRTAIAT
jgi:hypothetical protein